MGRPFLGRFSGAGTPNIDFYTMRFSSFRDRVERSCRCNPVQHQADCGDVDQGLRGLHPALIILRQATIETEPREAALDDPCQPSDRENTLPALEDSQLPAIAPELAGELAARVASIRDNRADRRQSDVRPASSLPPAPGPACSPAQRGWRAEGRAHRPECGVSVLSPACGHRSRERPLFARLDRLAIHDGNRRSRVSSGGGTGQGG
jgi:hypothetical protein